MRIELARADSVRTGDYIAGYATGVYGVVIGYWIGTYEIEISYASTEYPIGHKGYKNNDMILIGRAE